MRKFLLQSLTSNEDIGKPILSWAYYNNEVKVEIMKTSFRKNQWPSPVYLLEMNVGYKNDHNTYKKNQEKEKNDR